MYYTPSPIGFSNPTSVLTVQDKASRHNLSGILSQLPDLTSTQIVEQPQQQQQQQPQQQLFTITTSAAASSVAIQSGRVFEGHFSGPPNLPKTIIQLHVIPIPLPKQKSSVQILITRKKVQVQHLHHPKHETNNPWYHT